MMQNVKEVEVNLVLNHQEVIPEVAQVEVIVEVAEVVDQVLVVAMAVNKEEEEKGMDQLGQIVKKEIIQTIFLK